MALAKAHRAEREQSQREQSRSSPQHDQAALSPVQSPLCVDLRDATIQEEEKEGAGGREAQRRKSKLSGMCMY